MCFKWKPSICVPTLEANEQSTGHIWSPYVTCFMCYVVAFDSVSQFILKQVNLPHMCLFTYACKYTSTHYTSTHYTSTHYTSTHYTSTHYTSTHYTSTHYTSTHHIHINSPHTTHTQHTYTYTLGCSSDS